MLQNVGRYKYLPTNCNINFEDGMKRIHTQADRIMKMLGKKGVIRSCELARDKIFRASLARLVAKGRVERVGRGLYVLYDQQNITEFHSFAEVCKRIPHGVICLLSALNFHGITTQNPREIWMAIDAKARRPKVAYQSLRIVRFSGLALEEGIEFHNIEGVPVKVFNSAKTVADCFKYRNKIGLDVALEALREIQRSRKCSSDEIWRYARICRVSNVMRPYLEAMS